MMQDKPNEEQNEYHKARSDEEKENILGVEGKYRWPIRIVSFILFLATVGINYIYVNETGKISDKYALYVTPPGFFFAIWAPIFITMFLANLYNLVVNVWSFTAHIYLALTNICLIIWINVFNIGNDPAVYICFLILVLNVVMALKFWIELGKV